VPIYALDGAEPTIDPTAYVHPDAVIIGDVRLGPQASIWPGAVLRGDESHISVGARTSIQDGSVLHCTHDLPTVIGDDCVVGHIVHLEGCTIEDGALVGNGSVVLHRAVVGTGALVGSNAVVTNDTVIPAGAMALGVPAKIFPDRSHPGIIKLTAEVYVQRAERYRTHLRRID
jgi:carbonic anhydrase/acetyltransferase-like protein (isoleucine patch superfamily)